MARLILKARIVPDGAIFTVRGQEAKTLQLLIDKGKAGVVAYDFIGGPPFRLPAYTWALMKRHGLIIETVRESHEGGWHGRFVLHSPVEIVTDTPDHVAGLAVAA